MVKDIERSGHIDLERRCHPLCLGLRLVQERIVKVFEQRHVLRHRILKILSVDLMDRTVDNSLFNRLQAVLSAYDKLA